MAFRPRPPSRRLAACGCGATHATGFACDVAPADGTGAYGEVAQEAVLRAAFPQAATRRALSNAVGAGTLFAALDSVFPLARAREAMAQGAGAPEKRDLKIGFIPIT
ncbi:MAG: nitrate ABC transporter substrate-binding protein, partial [Alphaproteobacteria bacterium]